MEEIKEFINASQKEEVLKAFQNKSSVVSLDSLKGNRAKNILTINLLKDDGCITVTEYIGGKMDIRLTDKGYVYKELKAYSLLARRLKAKKIYTILWSIISFILGVLIDKVDVLLSLICGKN